MRPDKSVTLHPCARCGLVAKNITVWPRICNCGLQTNADGSTVSLRDHRLGDWVALGLARIGIRKRKGCGCERRKQKLNGLDQWARQKAVSLATFLHPR